MSNFSGYIGNVKLSVDILMKSIMQKKHRVRRQPLATTSATVTEYAGKVVDPLSNCCNNSESREEFRRGVAMAKMKKYKHHLDAIRPPTTKITTEISELERAARVRRGNIEIGNAQQKRIKPTRYPTTPKIYPIPNPTKTKLIEGRYSLSKLCKS